MENDNQKDISKIEEGLFNTSTKDIYIYRKTEKIASAIHYMTNFMNENEPIRRFLRDKSVSMLSVSLDLHSKSLCLIEIKSLLQTAFYSGLTSSMNFDIIKKEIDGLLLQIEAKRQNIFSLSSSFMEVPLTLNIEESKGHDKGQIKGQTDNKYIGQSISKPILKREQPINHPTSTSLNQSERTTKIFNLLKSGKELTIKDFSIIKGCSEKTLQRELLKLVAEGRIIKRGERRWSRYSLQ